MSDTDPVWFWKATFTDGAWMLFWADDKGSALDHAGMVARDGGTHLRGVVRLKHDKDITAYERSIAGALMPPPPPRPHEIS